MKKAIWKWGMLGLALASSAAFARPALEASLPSFAPFAWEDGNGKLQGALVDLYQQLAQRSGLDINVILLPYARLLHELEHGSLDMALIFKNDSVAGSVNFVGPVSLSDVMIITPPDLPVASWEQLYRLNNIAVIRKASFHPEFDKDTRLKKLDVNSYLQATTMLKLKRVDAVIGSKEGLEHALRETPLRWRDLSRPFLLGHKEWWLHVSKKSRHRAELALLEQAVADMYAPDLVYQFYIRRMPETAKASHDAR